MGAVLNSPLTDWGEMETKKDVLTVREVAELLSLDPYTVRDKARKGEIPGVQLGSGPKAQWRFSRKRIMELIEGRGGQV